MLLQVSVQTLFLQYGYTPYRLAKNKKYIEEVVRASSLEFSLAQNNELAFSIFSFPLLAVRTINTEQERNNRNRLGYKRNKMAVGWQCQKCRVDRRPSATWAPT